MVLNLGAIEMVQPLRILHIFRSPLGGLFRHVCDLVREQSAQGHLVGLICDNSTGGEQAETMLEHIEHLCALGILRIPMSRKIGLNDMHAPVHISKWALEANADVLHGHGAKGGAYARLARKGITAKTFYTPHGGSLHYSASSPMGLLYLNLEKLLIKQTDGFVFESEYSKQMFEMKVSKINKPVRVIHNGLREDEFKTVKLGKNPADFVFVGELRKLKGLDELLCSIKSLNENEKTRLVIAGSGPDEEYFKSLVCDMGLENVVSFIGFTPARQAFSLGRVMVMPSRAESFPYIVLEALAANKPLIATNVGGIPEIFGKKSNQLIDPENTAQLTKAMSAARSNPKKLKKQTGDLRKSVQEQFTVSKMGTELFNFYYACGAQASCSSEHNLKSA